MDLNKLFLTLIIVFAVASCIKTNQKGYTNYIIYDEAIENLNYQAILLKDKLLHNSTFNNEDYRYSKNVLKQQEELHNILIDFKKPSLDTLYKLDRYYNQLATDVIDDLSIKLNLFDHNSYEKTKTKLENFNSIKIVDKDSILASKLLIIHMLNRELFILETIDKMTLITICHPPALNEHIIAIDTLVPNKFIIDYDIYNLRIDSLMFDKYYRDRIKLNSSILTYIVYNKSLIYVQAPGTEKGNYHISGQVNFFNKNRGDTIKLSFQHNYAIY